MSHSYRVALAAAILFCLALIGLFIVERQAPPAQAPSPKQSELRAAAPLTLSSTTSSTLTRSLDAAGTSGAKPMGLVDRIEAHLRKPDSSASATATPPAAPASTATPSITTPKPAPQQPAPQQPTKPEQAPLAPQVQAPVLTLGAAPGASAPASTPATSASLTPVRTPSADTPGVASQTPSPAATPSNLDKARQAILLLQRTQADTLPAPGPATSAARAPTTTLPATPTAGSLSGSDYTIASGDTLSSIARRLLGAEKHWALIAQANPGLNPNRLTPGKLIRIPSASPKPAATAKPVSLPVPLPAERLSDAEQRKLANAANASNTGIVSGSPRTQPPSAGHVILAGDRLWDLAQRYYGNGAHWTTLYRNNRDVIGADPHRLPAGKTLRVPPLQAPALKGGK
jgi:nucleoid-associated protein YgaU